MRFQPHVFPLHPEFFEIEGQAKEEQLCADMGLAPGKKAPEGSVCYLFFICYKIIGEENSNKLSDTVYKYAYIIETDFADDKIDECVSALRSKLPTMDAFTNSFRNLGYSNHWGLYNDSKAKERCRLVLELIEKYISGRDINMEVTIEHILPDSQSVDNAQIGNLFLLEDRLPSFVFSFFGYLFFFHSCYMQLIPRERNPLQS